MNIKYEIIEGRLYIYLIGELDEHYAKGVKEYIDKLIDSNKYINAVVFNMSKVGFMDSTGIGMLLGRYKRLKKMGVCCFIENPTPSVEKVIEISGIYEIMPKMWG